MKVRCWNRRYSSFYYGSVCLWLRAIAKSSTLKSRCSICNKCIGVNKIDRLREGLVIRFHNRACLSTHTNNRWHSINCKKEISPQDRGYLLFCAIAATSSSPMTEVLRVDAVGAMLEVGIYRSHKKALSTWWNLELIFRKLVCESFIIDFPMFKVGKQPWNWRRNAYSVYLRN